LEEAERERLRYRLDFFMALEDLPVSCNTSRLNYHLSAGHI